jgi:DNA-binding transcriptional LysR family regulator
MPAIGDGIVNETLPPLEMVFVGPKSLSALPELSLEELLAHDIMTFQRGSQPHVALMERLRAAGAGSKRVHSVSSISALARLVESGFGIATLPLAAAEQLMPRNEIAVLRCELALTPLPMYASYWTYPAAPVLKQAMDEALAFARNYYAEE